MSDSSQDAENPDFAQTFSTTLERLLLRVKDRVPQALQGGVLMGTISLSSILGLSECAVLDEKPGGNDVNDPGLGSGKADWAQDEGRRDTSMVSYMNMYWHRYTNYNGRYGYQGVDVFIKVRVRPVMGADLNLKRVGVEYRIPGFPSRTAMGSYFSTHDDGYEEWHVRVALRASDPRVFVFNAWYQDGILGEGGRVRTYYDDNEGEFHPIAYDGAYTVVRQDFGQTRLMVGPGGIQGRIALVLSDLDYDKDVRIRYTTDDWATYREIRMGSRGTPNALYWDADLGAGQERWIADLDLPGAVVRMQYAILYRHGVVGGARPTEFWDNNGGLNYVVMAP